MSSLPGSKVELREQGESPLERPEPILDVYEHDFPLKTLLSLMAGIPIFEWESINAFECVLRLAEKWDAPGPVNFLRSALTTLKFIERHPLHCYLLATHFSWESEAKQASHHSLTLDVFNPMHRDTLDNISSKYVLSLLRLHHTRQIMFRELLHCPERFVAGNSQPFYCRRCCVTLINTSAWKAFKDRMIMEMERRPMGDTLNMGWPEAQACWQARCSKRDCQEFYFDRYLTVRQIEACIAILPRTIEWEN